MILLDGLRVNFEIRNDKYVLKSLVKTVLDKLNCEVTLNGLQKTFI